MVPSQKAAGPPTLKLRRASSNQETENTKRKIADKKDSHRVSSSEGKDRHPGGSGLGPEPQIEIQKKLTEIGLRAS